MGNFTFGNEIALWVMEEDIGLAILIINELL
jgi:hypothetical protein